MSAGTWLTQFIYLAGVHFLAVLSPGPDFAVTIGQSVRWGRRAGFLTALGIGAGISVHVVYTLLGMGVLVLAWPMLSLAVRLVGGGYLAYLGVKLLRARPRAPEPSVGVGGHDPDRSGKSHNNLDGQRAENGPQGHSPGRPEAVPSARGAFMTGFLTNATNPKATVFFLAIFTTIVSPHTPMLVQIFYGAWMCAVTALWFCVVSFLFSGARVRSQFSRLGHWFERLMGALLLGFAARLLWSV